MPTTPRYRVRPDSYRPRCRGCSPRTRPADETGPLRLDLPLALLLGPVHIDAGHQRDPVDPDDRRAGRSLDVRGIFERTHEPDTADNDGDVVGHDDVDAPHDGHRGDGDLSFRESGLGEVDVHSTHDGERGELGRHHPLTGSGRPRQDPAGDGRRRDAADLRHRRRVRGRLGQSLRRRRDPGHQLLVSRQIPGHRLQFAQCFRLVHSVEPLLEFRHSQPTLRHCGLQDSRDAFSIGVGGAQFSGIERWLRVFTHSVDGSQAIERFCVDRRSIDPATDGRASVRLRDSGQVVRNLGDGVDEAGRAGIGARVEPDLPGEPVPARNPAQYDPPAAAGKLQVPAGRDRAAHPGVDDVGEPAAAGQGVVPRSFVDQHLGAVGELVDDLSRDDREHPGGQSGLCDEFPTQPGCLVVADHPEPEPADGQHLSVRAVGQHLDVFVLVEHRGQLWWQRPPTPGPAAGGWRHTDWPLAMSARARR